jgi:serine phosphatase RsbU (regulator of sigma subunit)
MAQTAVRTLNALPEKDPMRFLSALNTTMYENVRRMNSDKNMSLLLLDYFQGKLSIVGQHEEVIVVRTSGDVERIDTDDLGFPIGMEADISAFIMQVHIDLAVGDVVVLYTDGITEAENSDRQLYGSSRLCEIIKQNASRSAQLICDAIIGDLKSFIDGFRVYDDITLVIIKKIREHIV